jgi:hypothetical protein
MRLTMHLASTAAVGRDVRNDNDSAVLDMSEAFWKSVRQDSCMINWRGEKRHCVYWSILKAGLILCSYTTNFEPERRP